MELNKYIDHTILNPDARKKDIYRVCDEAKKYDFKSVCVNSYLVKLVKDQLKDTDILTCATIAFPFGRSSTESKIEEAKKAIADGADELDMVINIGRFKDGDYDYVKNEISSIKKILGKRILKVIIETSFLNRDEIIKACQLVIEAKGDFVKTSTGYSSSGAKVDDVRLMKEVVKDKCKVKASGGIRTLKACLDMIDAGADRIGASRAVDFMEEFYGHR